MNEAGLLSVIVAVLGVNATMMGIMWRQQRNGRNGKPHHPSNPHNPDDLSQFRLGDMSAAWYDERHRELMDGLVAIQEAVEAK